MAKTNANWWEADPVEQKQDSAWYQADPIAADDVLGAAPEPAPMDGWDKAARGLRRLPGAVREAWRQGVGGLQQMVGEMAPQNPISPELQERIEQQHPEFGRGLRAAWQEQQISPAWAREGAAKVAEAQRARQASTPEDQSFMEEAIVNAGASLGLAVPIIAGAAVTRNPAAVAAAGMSAVETGSSYGDAREAGIDRKRAVEYAARNGLIEYGTEKFALGALFKRDPNFMTKVANFLVREVPGENVAAITQELNSVLSGVQPDTTVEEFISSIPRLMALTTTSTILAGGAQAGIVHGAQKVVDRVRGKDKAQEAEQWWENDPPASEASSAEGAAAGLDAEAAAAQPAPQPAPDEPQPATMAAETGAAPPVEHAIPSAPAPAAPSAPSTQEELLRNIHRQAVDADYTAALEQKTAAEDQQRAAAFDAAEQERAAEQQAVVDQKIVESMQSAEQPTAMQVAFQNARRAKPDITPDIVPDNARTPGEGDAKNSSGLGAFESAPKRDSAPDILTKSGQPFKTRKSAEFHAKAKKLEGYAPANTGVNKWVLRKVENEQSDIAKAQVETPVPQQPAAPAAQVPPPQADSPADVAPAARAPADSGSAPAMGAVESQPARRKPEGLDDARILRDVYRGALTGMLRDLQRGGGVALVPRQGAKPRSSTGNLTYDYDSSDLVRTPSLNPGWFQSMAEETGITTDQVKNAVDKALRGEKLGVRQARVVRRMLDEITGERTDPDNMEAARQRRREARLNLPPTDDYEQDAEARAGDLLDESEYDEEWDASARSLHELAAEAVAVSPDEAERILSDQSISNAEVARRLWVTIQTGKNSDRQEPRSSADTGGSESAATDTGPVAQTPASRDAPETPRASQDLLGDDTRQAQALADAKRSKDEKRSPAADVPADTGTAGDIFSVDANRQTDLVDAASERKAAEKSPSLTKTPESVSNADSSNAADTKSSASINSAETDTAAPEQEKSSAAPRPQSNDAEQDESSAMEEGPVYSGYERDQDPIQSRQGDARRIQETDGNGARQYSLFDTKGLPTAEASAQAADNFLVRYKSVPAGEVRVGVEKVSTPEDAAHVMSFLRRHGQEAFLVLVTDGDGNILNLIRHTKGLKDSANVDPATVVGAVAATDGAAHVWYGHNHPSGDPTPSSADRRLTITLDSALDGTGIQSRGHIILGAGTSAYHFDKDGWDTPIRIKPLLRKRSIPITERVIRKQPPADRMKITSPKDAIDVIRSLRAENSILLLDTRNQVAGVVALSPQEMSHLRRGGRVNRILRAVDTTNAGAVVIASSDRDAAENAARFLNGTGMRVLDAIIPDSKGALTSSAQSNIGVEEQKGAWFSRGKRDRNGITAAAARTHAAKLMRDWADRPAVHVVQSEAELPAELREKIEEAGAEGDVKGVFWRGSVYIVADKMPSLEEAERTILHETVGHYGLRRLLGNDLKPILNQVWLAYGRKGHEDIIRRYFTGDNKFDPTNQAHRHLVAEEKLAHMSESGEKPTLLKRLYAALRDWLRRMGFTLKLSDADLQLLLDRARSAVEKGGREVAPEGLTAFARESEARMARDRTNIDTAMRRMGKFVDEFLLGRLKDSDTQILGNTPAVLQALGAKNLPIQIDGKVVHKAIRDKHRHTMTAEMLKQIPEGLYDPLAVYDSPDPLGKPGKLILTEIRDRKGDPVIAAVHLDKMTVSQVRVNRIASVYDLENAATRLPRKRLEYVRNKESLASLRSLGFATTAGTVQTEQGSGVRILTEEDVVNKYGPSFSRDNLRSQRAGDMPQTETPEFKRWFGDSKVVDAEGKPLVVYHGTTSDFSAFRPDAFRGQSYFTDDPRVAGTYARGEGVLYPVYLNISRPFEHDFGGGRWDNIKASSLPADVRAKLNPAHALAMRYGDADYTLEAVAGAAGDAGYDGTIAKNIRDSLALKGGDVPATVFIVNKPEQIKSAIGNRGTFDASNPDIRFSRGNGPKRDADETPAASAIDRLQARAQESAVQRLKDKAADWTPNLYAALTLQQMVDVGAAHLPQLRSYSRTVTQMQADMNGMQQAAAQVAEKWARWARSNRPAARRLAQVMHDATIAGVDPAEAFVPADIAALKSRIDLLKAVSRSRSGEDQTSRIEEMKYLKAKIKGEPTRENEYKRLREQFALLPKEARDLYREVRDSYIAQSEDMLVALQHRIQGSDASTEVKRRIMDKLRLHFEQARVEGPYFPLARFGEYWAEMVDTNGERQFMMFEHAGERRAAIASLQKEGYVLVKQGRKLEKSREVFGTSSLFMTEVTGLLDQVGGNKADEFKDALYQLYLQQLPDLSMRKAFIHRKKVSGYSQDALRAYAHKMFHGASQIARLRHSGDMERLIGDMQETAKEVDDNTKHVALINELQKRHQWVMNPDGAAWANTLTGFGFVWYLGLGVSSALVNLTQTPVVAFPILGAKFGTGRAGAALLRASKDVAAKRISADERAMLDRLEKAGVIDRTMAHDLAGIGDTPSGTYSDRTARAMRVVSFMFHHAERFNREATALAAYRLAGRGDAAVEYAQDAVWKSHFDYSNTNRARWMQPNIAKVLFLFKQYALNMTYHLWRNAYQSIKGESPAVRAEARKILVGTLGVTALIAGASGLPLFGIVMGIANAAAAAFGDDDEWDAEREFYAWLKERVGKDGADMILRGPASDITGADIASRSSLDGMWLRSPEKELEGKAYAHYLLEQAAGPIAGGLLVSQLRGIELLGEGQTQRGIEAMTPKFARDAIRAFRYAEEGATSMRGDPLIDKFGTWELVLQASGFTPERLAERYDTNSRVKAAEQAIMDKRQALTAAFALARLAGDQETADSALEKIRAFNERHPGAAISGDTLRRSIMQRAKLSAQADGGIITNRRLEGDLERYR